MEDISKKKTSIACGAICEDLGKILMVEEYRPDEGYVLNQPVGELESSENIFEGTKREVFEETGLNIELTFLVGVYVWLLNNGNTSIRFCFVGKVTGGDLRPEIRTDNESVKPIWLSPEELKKQVNLFRNPVTGRCLQDYFSGIRYPLDLVVNIYSDANDP